jgi:TRAP transporter TAXI family solute receptor
VFTILARKDAKVASFDDLKGKRVNIGNPGSGQRDTFEEIMTVKGWDKSAFSLVSELKPAEQASALGDNNIDAMSYFVGHPNGAIQEASTTTDTVLVPVTGPEIDKLLAEKSYYSKAEIPGGSTRAARTRPRPSVARRCSPPAPRLTRKWSTSWSSPCSTTWTASSACTRPSRI